ncbi:hypothetical protein ACFVIM_13765 [Streptomyces sp. NPDC057638]|uniref:hypothetical protein n=1 Tax=Streptomyces sp. NPDC057638 TaxID=3346190 RepID=UPI0036B04D21
MVFSVSALAVTGVILFLLIRYKALGIVSATVALLFGFYLAKTGAADSIDQIMTTFRDTVSNW